jgi:hypothetical protein
MTKYVMGESFIARDYNSRWTRFNVQSSMFKVKSAVAQQFCRSVLPRDDTDATIRSQGFETENLEPVRQLRASLEH